MANNKVCPKCGTPYNGGEKYCTKCGMKRKQALINKPWFLVLVTVLVLVAFGYTDRNPAKNSKSTPETQSSISSSIEDDAQGLADTKNNADTADESTGVLTEASESVSEDSSLETASNSGDGSETKSTSANLESETENNSAVESLSGEGEDSDYVFNGIVDYDFINANKTNILVCAKMTLDKFIADYDMSLAPQKWDVVLFDDNNNVMASTDITFNSVKGRYYYVGELNLDEDGKVLGGSPHYLSVLDQTLYDDGYCDEFFETLKTAEEAYEG